MISYKTTERKVASPLYWITVKNMRNYLISIGKIAVFNAAVDVAPQNAASSLKGDNMSGAHLVLCIDSCLVVKENKT